MTNPGPEFKASDTRPILFPLHHAHLFYLLPYSPPPPHTYLWREGKRNKMEGKRNEVRKGIIMILF